MGGNSSFPSSTLECPALHVGRHGYPQLLENGRCHIHQLKSCELMSTGCCMDVGIVLDHNTKLGMVAIIGADIVLKRVNGTVSDSTNRPPEQIAEVDNQIGR